MRKVVSIDEMMNEIYSSFSKSREEMRELAYEQSFPQSSEPALIHPSNSSIVKIKDNGNIDIFSQNENGFRLHTEEKKIQVHSNQLEEQLGERITKIDENEEKEVMMNQETTVWGKKTTTVDRKSIYYSPVFEFLKPLRKKRPGEVFYIKAESEYGQIKFDKKLEVKSEKTALQAKEKIHIKSKRIDLVGDVYINGRKVTIGSVNGIPVFMPR